MKRLSFALIISLVLIFVAAQGFAQEQRSRQQDQQQYDQQRTQQERGRMDRQQFGQQQQQQQWQRQAQRPQRQDIGRGFVKASDLMDSSVVGQEGQELGSVEDLVLTQDGRIRFIVLSRGGTLGIGGELYAVPFEIASPQPEDGQVRISLNESVIENAPSFQEGDWPNFAERQYQNRVYGYYGQQQQRSRQQQEGMYQQQQPRLRQQQPMSRQQQRDYYSRRYQQQQQYPRQQEYEQYPRQQRFQQEQSYRQQQQYQPRQEMGYQQRSRQ